jgi:hypothetical protein
MIGRRAGALLPACAMLTLAAPACTQTPRPGVGLPWRPFRFPWTPSLCGEMSSGICSSRVGGWASRACGCRFYIAASPPAVTARS